MDEMMDRIIMDIVLPANFPEKYSDAVVSAANHCAVKKHLNQVLGFVINVINAEATGND
jgi:ribosomal protein S12 methylthiotransferase accessory factor